MTRSDTPTVKCPTCAATVPWSSDQPYRPFCSERCKLIDLGDWATEAHKIPGEPAVPLDELDDRSPFGPD